MVYPCIAACQHGTRSNDSPVCGVLRPFHDHIITIQKRGVTQGYPTALTTVPQHFPGSCRESKAGIIFFICKIHVVKQCQANPIASRRFFADYERSFFQGFYPARRKLQIEVQYKLCPVKIIALELIRIIYKRQRGSFFNSHP